MVLHSNKVERRRDEDNRVDTLHRRLQYLGHELQCHVINDCDSVAKTPMRTYLGSKIAEAFISLVLRICTIKLDKFL